MKRTKLLADQAEGNPATTTKRQWQATAVALAAAALLSLPSQPAHALALGRVTVQSALGEPLRVEIDVPEITPDEVASLRVNVASPDAFRAAGLDYGPAVSGISVNLQRRSDGRYFLRLSSDRPVAEPFVDVILETAWGSGRIVRDFTMLFDPPAMRQAQTPLTAQVAPSASPAPAGRTTPAPVAPERAARPASPGAAAPVARAPATPAPAAPAAPAAPVAPGSGNQVTVQAGETAGKIAAAHKTDAVSLDQMLLALLRANPEAFVGNNVNRLRAGAVLNLPSEEQAQAVPAGEARQTLVAQSRDFNEFRRRLAEGVPTAPAAGTSREAGGRVQAQVEEKRPAAAAPDKLTLSKGAVQGRGGSEDKVAQNRAAQDASNRVAELNRNISELNKLTGALPGAAQPAAGASAPSTAATAAARPASSPSLASVAIPAGSPAAAVQAPTAAAPASSPVSTASAPVVAAVTPASAPAAAAASAFAAAASAPSTDAAPAPAAAAPASAPAAAAPKRPVAPPPIQEPSLLDELLGNPLIPASLGGALALLLGLGVWKARQRRKSAQVDSSFLESRLQPDSFFGASGGQRIDTNEGAPTGSSMVYSPSQLDAAGDVDPVAEADVYLAYGRDLQAEEILKEALRINPQRIAIHTKLLEIYAKRRDTKAFEQLAGEVYGLTHGAGPEWSHICELGLDLDPSNPMYQPGGQPSGNAPLAAASAVVVAGVAAAASAQPAPAPAPAADSGMPSIDLDLDFSLDDSAPAAKPSASAAPQPPAVAPAVEPAAEPLLSMDFGSATQPVAIEPPAAQFEAPSLTLPDDNSLNFEASAPAPVSKAPAPAAPAAPAADSGMIEFDLGALSLDLPAASAPAPEPATVGGDSLSTGGLELDTNDGEDPLATKLALAQEFNAIGDADGARSLAQEVIAEASGDLKSKAQKFLAEIG